MYVQLFTLVLICLFDASSTEFACERWRKHKNFDLVHSGRKCGREKLHSSISNRVFNGRTAPAGSLPWMAHVTTESGGLVYECGGSIINQKYILTAAHCVNRDNPKITVVVGLSDKDELNWLDLSISALQYNVSKYVIHKNYNNAMKNDIALLRLEKSIAFGSYINYICLPLPCEIARKKLRNEKLSVSGWGYINNGTEATSLQEVELPVKKCKAYKKQNKTYQPDGTQICAGSGDVMTCRGDSGGPLLYKTPERAFQVGILSAGPNGCATNPNAVHSIFTRVSSFMGWILNNIEPNNASHDYE